MKIINNKDDAIQELKRISTRTNSENNNKITAIVEEILLEVKNYGDKAVEKYTKMFDGFDPDPMHGSPKGRKIVPPLKGFRKPKGDAGFGI